MDSNVELDLAWRFVNNTNRNIFLTGKAGTGKTTFLHNLKRSSLKRMIVVAPTGVAAINAKGITIHSFFQLPFRPIIPNQFQIGSNFNKKFSKTKINIIKSLDLLIIDEISMVRADLLDGIDEVLRRYRNKNLVFGGVQLLMIGDLQQLSPVIKQSDWVLLKPFYNNAFFFSSKAYNVCNPISIELQKIYRQDNPRFINILNEIRSNTLSKSSIDELNNRFLPDFVPESDEGYISLTTHNIRAERVNSLELEKLEGTPQVYLAKVEGRFPEYSYPNKQELVLKVGAQVMFVKNDTSLEKRYFNGKIGTVVLLNKDEVVVKCPDDDFSIATTPESWENINYSVDSTTKAISENKIGSYSQIPLRLAWSITIHKSQGLTFEKAIIDSQGAFAHGQTYVALSRCKSLEGLILKSKIDSSQIISDSNVKNFTNKAEDSQPNEAILQQSKNDFQLHLISEIFDFYKFLFPINRIIDIFYKNRNAIEGNLETPLIMIKDSITSLLKVANGFNYQIKELCNNQIEPEKNELLQKRIIKAIAYFNLQTKTCILEPYNTFTFSTDNKALEKDICKQLDVFEELLSAKQLFFQGLTQGFNTTNYLELRAKSVFLAKEKPKKLRKTVINGTTNVELFELLRELRNTIAQREDLVHYQIFTQKALYAMCESLPTNKVELKQIHGMGKTRIEKYGSEILDVIITYCTDNEIETSSSPEIFENPKPNRKKGDTKKTSLALFQSGKSIDDIAIERELNINTIFGHLASFIDSGEIKITDIISEDTYSELKKIIPTKTFENLSDLKHQLDEKYSFAEIRLVLDEFSK
ncbi:helix-turn-helix domain-containing protein [Psychroserpens sp.]|uniref:helix-turn-helix domain-containing protein n=1 Tax=Psychroserpens sp. TaxID=2020870 RepID=UPI002B27895E|nr:helix-turn-helix domain-containing protein [Psychroserpens sp.]